MAEPMSLIEALYEIRKRIEEKDNDDLCQINVGLLQTLLTATHMLDIVQDVLIALMDPQLEQPDISGIYDDIEKIMDTEVEL